MSNNTIKPPTLLQSIIPIIVLIGLISCNVLLLGNDTLSGANQLALLFASAVAVFISWRNGIKWTDTMQGMIHTLIAAIPAILILLVIGMLSGTWMLSGIVPSMIYYGLNILEPSYFLPATLILCSIISVAVGSSWSTIATIGVALLGIGKALGFSEAIVAGAIISGAYFGDKISPLSDTTNLASAVTETPLFTHIRYMMYTTVPSMLLTIGLFVLLTFVGNQSGSDNTSQEIQNTISSFYHVSPWLFIVPIITIFMIVKKIPAVPVLFIGALLGAITAIIAQPDVIASLTPDGKFSLTGVYTVLAKCLYGTTEVSTGNPAVDNLLTTGGMGGMLNTIWLIITAMMFGGIMEAGQFLEKIMITITKKVSSTGGLVSATAGTTILFNLTAGDQYMAIVIPGKMFAKSFRQARLAPQVLSRTLEDSGTVTSVLIPWNTCGATQASILGVATAVYAPFAFFCYLSPIMTVVYAWLNIKIKRINAETKLPAESD